MEALDWLVIGVFFLALIGIIVWVVRQKQNDSADYFLGGRDATWLAIGASIFASNIGSEHLIGLAGAGASSGMAMAHWEIQGWMILILGWVFVPFYTRSMVYTMPEFLERRYNPQSRTILSGSPLFPLPSPENVRRWFGTFFFVVCRDGLNGKSWQSVRNVPAWGCVAGI